MCLLNRLAAVAATTTVFTAMDATADEFNYDEAKVPEFELPDPLVMKDGTKVETEEAWKTKRRAEVMAYFKEQMYGTSPGRPDGMTFKVFDTEDDALGGKARRKQVRVRFAGQKDGPGMDILIYLPKASGKPVPAIVGLNFQGNHSISDDPGIRLSANWMAKRRSGVVDNLATEKSRGVAKSRWAIETIVGKGYGIATIYCGDIDPDFHDGFKNGVHALYPDLNAEGKGDNFSTISAWAWGLSRALDYFETDPDMDAKKVGVIGHSRLGKTSLWAGAQDERFALVISNDSGCGGAALSKRRFGETVKRINTSFPHWFCENFKKYNDNEAALPFDQHMLISLIAPRPVYVASAESDRWADPKGEFLSAKNAEAVYRLLGADGLPSEKWPEVGVPVHGGLAYHVRAGKHDVTDFDWEQYLKFADKHLR